METSLDTKESTSVTEINVSNYGTDEVVPTLFSEEDIVKLEEPSEVRMEDFEGYTSGKFAEDYSLAEEDKDFTAKPIQPVSSNPSVLDLLYTTY